MSTLHPLHLHLAIRLKSVARDNMLARTELGITHKGLLQREGDLDKTGLMFSL